MSKTYILLKDLPEEITFKRFCSSSYYVSESGMVLSTQTGKFLKGYYNNGYVWFDLWVNGEKVRKSQHVLIATCFIANPNNLPIVRHLNDNTDDIRIENLAWGTKADNMNDAVRNGLLKNRPSPKGIKHSKAKLTDEKVIQMRKDFNSGVHYKDLSVKYGIAGTYVYDICKGRRWKHVV